ncbi:MAG: HPr(Ser) kinase/phosphatase [Eubacteriales bacterium]|nr:HPr(Ser) kinase/phosphatase [Eubacteriales bacterium]
MAKVKIMDFAAAIGLEIVLPNSTGEMELTSADINRAGLQLAGFFDYFANDRVQIIGNVESYYLKSIGCKEKLDGIFADLFAYQFPCLIFAHNCDVLDIALKYGKMCDCPIFKTKQTTTLTIQKLIPYLQSLLAETISLHGVLMDVYGVGMLLLGNSGIGKSETAMELVKREHRLVADDAVVIRKVSPTRLVGCSPENTKYLMEIRGVGIINVKEMYGIGAVIDRKTIDMIVQMQPWDDNFKYDRMGIETKTHEILGIALPELTIPIRPGRNLAIIMEVAAKNYRLKALGYNAAEELLSRVNMIYADEK